MGPIPKIGVNVRRTTIPNRPICWAKLGDLETRNVRIMVVTDAVQGNDHHCLVNDITPNQMVKALRYKP